MNKRTDTIRNLFAQTPTALSPDNTPRLPSGPVRSMQDAFSDVERENEALRAQLAEAPRSWSSTPS